MTWGCRLPPAMRSNPPPGDAAPPARAPTNSQRDRPLDSREAAAHTCVRLVPHHAPSRVSSRWYSRSYAWLAKIARFSRPSAPRGRLRMRENELPERPRPGRMSSPIPGLALFSANIALAFVILWNFIASLPHSAQLQPAAPTAIPTPATPMIIQPMVTLPPVPTLGNGSSDTPIPSDAPGAPATAAPLPTATRTVAPLPSATPTASPTPTALPPPVTPRPTTNPAG